MALKDRVLPEIRAGADRPFLHAPSQQPSLHVCTIASALRFPLSTMTPTWHATLSVHVQPDVDAELYCSMQLRYLRQEGQLNKRVQVDFQHTEAGQGAQPSRNAAQFAQQS